MSTRKYETAVPLGRGATGEVVRSWDAELQRPVALKLLHRLDAEAVERLKREARAQARVEHPHVARVYEVGELDGRPYIAMQLIEGEPLDVAAADLSVDEKVRLFLPVVEAVQAAHAAGLIHRDLKPGNILVERREDGGLHPYVLDFGVSRAHDVPGLTVTGEVLGTPQYMSPEQARGLTRELDRRSDLFSLGVILYELLTGVRPFEADSVVGVLLQVLQADPPPLRRAAPHLPGDLEAIVGRCLQKDPERRYPSLRALADDLERYLAGEPVAARPPGPLERVERWTRRHRLAATAIVMTLVALLLVGAVSVYSGIRAQEQALAAQRFGAEVERIQSILRRDHALPLHDTRPAVAQVRSRVTEMETRLAGLSGASAAPGHYALGRSYLALGEHEEARRRLERAVELGASDPETAYALGLALGEIYRERRERLVHVRDEEERERQEEEIRASLRAPALRHLERARGSEEVSARYVEGLIAFYEERWEDAVALAREAARELPWFWEARKLEGDALTHRGRQHTLDGDFDAARRDLEAAGEAYAAALEVGRSAPSLHAVDCQRRRLGMVVGMMSSGPDEAVYQEARAACERGMVAHPDDARVWREVANLEWRWAENLWGAGEDPAAHLDRAIEAAERSLALEPDHVGALSSLATANEIRAEVLVERGRDPEPALERVVAVNQRILELAPLYERAHASIATALQLRSQRARNLGEDPLPHLDGAIEHMRRAVEINPLYAWHGNLARLLREKAETLAERGGDPMPALDESLEQGRIAVEMNADYFGYWYQLARTHLLRAEHSPAPADAAGSVEEGLAAVARALEIHPEHESSRELKDLLEALRHRLVRT